MKNKNIRLNCGFTIVELLIAIVIIGILAAITIVSYIGISKKATEASLISDLAGAKQQLSLYQVEHESFPDHLDSNNCPQDSVNNTDTKYCLKTSASNIYEYNANNNIKPNSFGLTSINIKHNVSYRTAGDSTYVPCAPGFIIVPGSATYGTSDFCVMKYEARQDGYMGTPISSADSEPWSDVSQVVALSSSPKVVGCDKCHLVSEAEWLTIAQNVLGVSSNWSGNAVGSGYIFSGHNDDSPSKALSADKNDNNAYKDTGNDINDMSMTNYMVGNSQRRTLTLSNGEVIWDMAGNLWEWTTGQISGNQPGIVGKNYTDWNQWTDIPIVNIFPNPSPGGTGIANSNSWNNSNGLGMLISDVTDISPRGFLRSGNWYDNKLAGVLSLNLSTSPTSSDGRIGFRVSR